MAVVNPDHVLQPCSGLKATGRQPLGAWGLKEACRLDWEGLPPEGSSLQKML